MQQFTVPQFIDVEDKIIGPITTRQFIIMLSGFMFIGLSYKIFDFSLFIVVGITIFGVSGIFAFLKINGMPFHYFILNFIQTFKRPGLRIWNNYIYKVEAHFESEEAKVMPERQPVPTKIYTTSRLAELSLIVDTQGAYKGEKKSGKDIIKTNIDNLHDKST